MNRPTFLEGALVALVAAFGIATVALMTGPGGAPAAEAAVLPTVQPVRVVLSGPTATLRTTVIATAPTTYNGGYLIALSAPLPVIGETRVLPESLAAMYRQLRTTADKLFPMEKS